MLIPTDQIDSWQDLQNKVASFFQEMGYHTTTPKIIELAARGRKEIDVYIEDPRASVNQVMLVECKFWTRSVSQDTVHSMHTIMHGSGANTGFIISKAGFQRGAYEAASNTNIHLLTWEELQHKFGRQWLLHKHDQLKLLLLELRGIDSAYLDQMNPFVTIANTMRFEATGLLSALYEILGLIRIVLLAEMVSPRAYDMLGPIEVSAQAGMAEAIQDKYGCWVLRLASVRDYFQWVLSFGQTQIDAFRLLQQTANRKFDALPDQGSAAFDRVFDQIAEETPIRVFRKHNPEAYDRLIASYKANDKRKSR